MKFIQFCSHYDCTRLLYYISFLNEKKVKKIGDPDLKKATQTAVIVHIYIKTLHCFYRSIN